MEDRKMSTDIIEPELKIFFLSASRRGITAANLSLEAINNRRAEIGENQIPLFDLEESLLTADREPVTNYFLSIMKKEIPDLPAYEPDVKQLIDIWYQAQQMPVKSIAHELNNPGRADILKMHGDFISARIFNARNFTPNIGNSALEGNQTFRIAE